MKYLIIIFISILFYTPIANAQAATTGSNDDYYATNVNDVTDGLVLWWPGRHQGMSYAQDVSQYKVQGTITGATWGTGTGRGLYFDGVNDYVSLGYNAGTNIEGSSSVSICAWVYPTNQFGITQRICMKLRSPSGSNRGGFSLYSNGSGQALFAIANNTPILTLTSNAVCGTNTWNFVCGTYDTADGSQKLYINSVLDNTGTFTTGIGTHTTTNVLISTTTAGQVYGGFIEDVRIYNRALSSDEVNRIYVSNPH